MHFAGVTGHDFVAVGDDGFQGFLVGHSFGFTKGHFRWHFFDRGQTEKLEDADVHPADVELVGFDRELGRGRVGVVVVVQLFAADDDAPWRHVGAGVDRFEVAVAPPVTQTVDDAGGRHGRPDHLHGPDSQAQSAEQGHVDDEHQAHAQARTAGVDVFFQPVVGGVVAVTFQGFFVLGLGAVQLRAFQQDFLDAEHDGAVRVAVLFAFGVVFAVNGGPFFGDHAGGHPQPETEKVRRNGVQVQRAVGLVAVQKDGDAGDRDVGEHQGHDQHLPPSGAGQAVDQEIDHSVRHGEKVCGERIHHVCP